MDCWISGLMDPTIHSSTHPRRPRLDPALDSLHLWPMSKFAWFVLLTMWVMQSARVGTAADVIPVELEASASSVDWPQFRGPTGQGISGGNKMPLHWNCRPDGSCSP